MLSIAIFFFQRLDELVSHFDAIDIPLSLLWWLLQDFILAVCLGSLLVKSLENEVYFNVM